VCRQIEQSESMFGRVRQNAQLQIRDAGRDIGLAEGEGPSELFDGDLGERNDANLADCRAPAECGRRGTGQAFWCADGPNECDGVQDQPVMSQLKIDRIAANSGVSVMRTYARKARRCRVLAEIRQLVVRMAEENPTWG